MAQLLSVNVATVRTDAWAGRMGRTGIDKRPAAGPLRATRDGLTGDTICDQRYHGGHDRALYAFAADDYDWWREQLGRSIPWGSFGENLTIADLNVTSARIGDRWALGSAVVEVTAPRIPCRVFAGFWDLSDLIRRFTERGRPGAYLRVIEEGAVAAGDEVRVIRSTRMLTIGESSRAMTSEPDLLGRLAEAAGFLPADIRGKLERRSARPRVP